VDSEQADAAEPTPPDEQSLVTRVLEFLIGFVVMPCLYSIFITMGLIWFLPWPLSWMDSRMCGDGELVFGVVDTGSDVRGLSRDATVECVGGTGDEPVGVFRVFFAQYPFTVIVVALVVFGFTKLRERRAVA
jgi:hypothetical protein